MDSNDQKKIIIGTERLVRSLSANSAAFNTLLDIFLGAQVLPDDSYKNFLVYHYHAPKQVNNNIREFLDWLRASAHEQAFDIFCRALEKIGLKVELASLLNPSRDTLEPDGKALGAEIAAVCMINAKLSAIISFNEPLFYHM